MSDISPADMLDNVLDALRDVSSCTVVLTYEWDFRENFANIELWWGKRHKIVYGAHLLESVLDARAAVESVVEYLCQQGWQPVERKTHENLAESYNPSTGGYWLGSGTLTVRYVLSQGEEGEEA